MKVFEILTLFPEAFPGTLDLSIIKNARGVYWDMKAHDMREYGIGKHKIVDDEVFSHLPGMLIRPDVVENAIEGIGFEKGRKIFLSPRGRVLDQRKVEELANANEKILLLCGRYEGIDQRAIDYFGFEEVSIGNYILCGAEVAAMVLMEAVIRKLPGVIGNSASFVNESFASEHELEISENRYTRPAIWTTKKGDILEVDSILRSGDHKKIELFQKNGRKGINKGIGEQNASVSARIRTKTD